MPIPKNKKKLFPGKSSKKAFAFVLLAFISIGLTSATAYYFGFNDGLKETKNITIEGVSNMDKPDHLGGDADFSIFWEAWSTLQEKHPDVGGMAGLDLIYGAIEGLTNSIGDPNTVFLTPSDSQKFSQDINGEFSGVGMEIGIREDQLVIITPLKNTPAERAGLTPGDKILAIDDQPTATMTLDEAAKTIRGEKGTVVVLTIRREGRLDDFDVSVERDRIKVPTMDSSLVGENENILHLQIYSFNRNLIPLLYTDVLRSALNRPEAIILDLRNNPGGFLDVSVDVAGIFIPDGETVVIERFSSGEEETFRANGNDNLKDIPIVILVNEGSASASEILAGAIRIHRGSQIVGQKTFGKGTVQQLEELSDGSTLKVTIAEWLLPDGSLIEGNGLIPDYEVEITEEQFLAGEDPQLDKAIEIAESKI